MFKRFATLLALSLAMVAGASAQEAQMNLQRVKLSAGMYQIDAQVALTSQQMGKHSILLRKAM